MRAAATSASAELPSELPLAIEIGGVDLGDRKCRHDDRAALPIGALDEDLMVEIQRFGAVVALS